MDIMGKLSGASRDYSAGSWSVTFSTTYDIKEALDDLVGKELVIKADPYSEDRGLNANSYFHVLNRKLAKKLKHSEAYMKNQLIGSYGQPQLIGFEQFIYKTTAPVEFMMEQEYIHTKPIRFKTETNASGEEVETIFYKVMRPSHSYTKEEMNRLIEGTVQEAKTQGIETMSPSDAERLVNMWKPKKS